MDLSTNDSVPEEGLISEEAEKSSDNSLPSAVDSDSKIDTEKVADNSEAATKNSESDSSVTYDPKDIQYEGEVAVYTDPVSKYQYTWNKEKNEWELRNYSYGFEDDTHTYTDADGIKFFWDKDKNAWFPKINDDFMAQYQMNYGFVDNTQPEKEKTVEKAVVNEVENPQSQPQKKGEKRKPSEPSWFELDSRSNTKVYVSNLPLDITEEEFVEMMQKCGLIMKDESTGKLKIKLYKDASTDFFKGDALCTYIRVESVELALKLIDGSKCKGKVIQVERAQFQMKGDYDPKLKPKSKKRKEKQKLRKIQEKLLDWRPEKAFGERAQHERVVIVRNLFEPNVFDENVSLILEFQEDLRDECKKCGDVRKVIIYDRHPEGVAQINMKTPEEAEACVPLLNNRWFGKRKITAEIWDGKTKFKIAETDAQISERLEKWDQFLETEDESKAKPAT